MSNLLNIFRNPIGIIPTFSVHKNGTDQTGIVTSTFTKLTWSTEDLDTNSNFASNKFTPTVFGKYFLIGSARLISIGDQIETILSVYKNGVSHRRFDIYTSVVSSLSVPVLAIVEANGTTDYFELYIYHAYGSDRTVDGNLVTTYFQGFKITE